MVTCIDVAKKAGVSRQTVSRVINNNPNVSESTRKKVLSAIEKLNYHPNTLARSLKTSKSKSIGLIIPDASNPFYINIANLLQNKLKLMNYSIFIIFSNENEFDEKNSFRYMYEKCVDLILFVPASHNQELEDIIKSNSIPVVQLFRNLYDSLPSITINDNYGAYLATEELIKSGHKKIILVEGKYEFRSERLDGFMNALKDNGIGFEEYMYVNLSEDTSRNFNILSDIIRKHSPTAFIAVSTKIEICVLKFLEKAGLSFPDSISVIFYDDNEVSELLNITSITHDMEKISDTIVQKISTCLKNPENAFHKQLKPLLCVRKSVKEPVI